MSETGAHAFYFDGHSIRTETVAAARGARPWSGDMPTSTPAPDASAFARGRDADGFLELD